MHSSCATLDGLLRSTGIEYFIHWLLAEDAAGIVPREQRLPDMEFLLNTADNPQLHKVLMGRGTRPAPVFSFSVDSHFADVMCGEPAPCKQAPAGCLGSHDASPRWHPGTPQQVVSAWHVAGTRRGRSGLGGQLSRCFLAAWDDGTRSVRIC